MKNADGAETRIILIRHGQTAWNREEVFRGRAGVPLDDVGLQQAEAVAAALQEEPIALVVASPLSRAVQTARAVAQSHKLPVVNDDAFTDIDFGQWQGVPAAQVQQQYPELYAAWLTRPHHVRFPGGEDLNTVAARAFAGLEALAECRVAETIALVAHRVVNKLLICRVLGLDSSHFWQIKQDTACINRLSFGADGWVLECLNDTCHLRHLSAATGDF